MAKISAVDRAANLERYDIIILKLFLNKGWHHVSHTNVAAEAEVPRSSIQNYYPTGFESALQGKVFPIFIEYVDFSSAESLKESWMKSLDDRKFRYILNMLISNVSAESPHDFSKQGLRRLVTLALRELGIEGETAIKELLGETVIKFAQ